MFGKSLAANVGTVNCARPELTLTVSPVVSTVTLPSDIDRTMSLINFALATTVPSSKPPTFKTNCTDRSLSVHDNNNLSPVTSMRTPDSAGIALLRVDATRAAAPSASARTSRSTLNFIACSLASRCLSLNVDVCKKN
jgi:hypothetical protein